jgi:alanyl-tRNA synthetase
VEYGDEGDRISTVLRICADHARASSFLVHDGVVPSNEGRGYVLRKIMRRAMRNARMIGVQDPFLYQMTGFVAEWMKPAYPEMVESISRVARIVKEEEHRYATTFQVAEKVFHDEAKSASGGLLPGAAAFKLYDTYGLALDEQQEMAREFGLAIDVEGFEKQMDRQRELARASWKGAEKSQIDPIYREIHASHPTEFLGYDTLTAEGTVVALPKDGELILDRTPFYAEAGGQVGDQGALYSTTGEKVADVLSAYAPVKGLTVHRIKAHAPIQPGDKLRAEVDKASRTPTMRNHTATHLLQAALRRVLGPHVKQAGSVVDPARLRFDFSHYAPLDPHEIQEVERLVNEEIFTNAPVTTEVMDIDKALSTGAMALFGEKYGDKVRVVTVPDFSRELCGGTHVKRTGDIGICKIISEGGISAGVRRIEAVTAAAVVQKLEEKNAALNEQLERLNVAQKSLEKQVDQLKSKLAHAQVGELENAAHTIKGVKVLSAKVDGLDRQQLRELADSLRNKWKSCVVVLGSSEDSTVSLISAVTKDLTAKIHAGKLIGPVAQAVGGKGGGRPDMAEAGGSNPSALPTALESVYSTVEGML